MQPRKVARGPEGPQETRHVFLLEDAERKRGVRTMNRACFAWSQLPSSMLSAVRTQEMACART